VIPALQDITPRISKETMRVAYMLRQSIQIREKCGTIVRARVDACFELIVVIVAKTCSSVRGVIGVGFIIGGPRAG